MPMTIAGAHSTFEGDYYVLLVGWEELNASTATFKVYLNPLINLVWWGGIVLILGTFIAAWPAAQLAVSVQPSAASRKRPVTV
jgi:cytochrome c-type biogenesis protein CcmF